MARTRKVEGKSKVRRKVGCRCTKFWNFTKRAAYMLLVLFVAAILISSLGGEAFRGLDFVKEAASSLAEAAADAFGEEA